MSKIFIETDKAPAAIGPYSQAVQAGDLLYVSGQLPIDGISGKIPEGVEEQTRQSLTNIKLIVEAAGGRLADIIKCTVYLKDMNNFASMNKIYAEYFTANCPARVAVEVSRLPKDVDIEIEAIAVISK